MNINEDIDCEAIEAIEAMEAVLKDATFEMASKLVDADQAAYIKELEDFVIEFNYAPRPLMGPSDYAKTLFARIEARRARDCQGGDA